MTPTSLDGENIANGNQIVPVKSYLKDQNYFENGQVIIEQQKIGNIS